MLRVVACLTRTSLHNRHPQSLSLPTLSGGGSGGRRPRPPSTRADDLLTAPSSPTTSTTITIPIIPTQHDHSTIQLRYHNHTTPQPYHPSIISINPIPILQTSPNPIIRRRRSPCPSATRVAPGTRPQTRRAGDRPSSCARSRGSAGWRGGAPATATAATPTRRRRTS